MMKGAECKYNTRGAECKYNSVVRTPAPPTALCDRPTVVYRPSIELPFKQQKSLAGIFVGESKDPKMCGFSCWSFPDGSVSGRIL